MPTFQFVQQCLKIALKSLNLFNFARKGYSKASDNFFFCHWLIFRFFFKYNFWCKNSNETFLFFLAFVQWFRSNCSKSRNKRSSKVNPIVLGLALREIQAAEKCQRSPSGTLL